MLFLKTILIPLEKSEVFQPLNLVVTCEVFPPLFCQLVFIFLNLEVYKKKQLSFLVVIFSASFRTVYLLSKCQVQYFTLCQPMLCKKMETDSLSFCLASSLTHSPYNKVNITIQCFGFEFPTKG